MTERELNQDETKERRTVRVTDRRRVRLDEPGAPVSAEGGPRPAESASGAEEGAANGPGGAAGGEQAQSPVVASEGGEPTDVTAELESAKNQIAEYRDHLQRLQADFENYKKRVLKENTRLVERATEHLVDKLLEVLDEFELALMAAGSKPDFDRFLHGVELVYAKLTDILRSEGLERIDALGKPFDPTLHEALMQGEGGEGDPFVADVLRPGYTLRGRVIRPAGVKVARR